MLQKFVNRNGETLYEDDILAILRRYDADEDARLSYQEFASIIMPRGSKKHYTPSK